METPLRAGAQIIHNDSFMTVSAELAAKFQSGDRLLIAAGKLLHVPKAQLEIAGAAVAGALSAFAQLATVDESCLDRFYQNFADHLADDRIWDLIGQANGADVERARQRGRSTTRLTVNPKMRQDMIAGLKEWQAISGLRNRVIESQTHQGWTVEQVTAGVGVVAFIFEGRPNVFADATGVLRGGNTTVMRIGSDALGTARAIMSSALQPALASAGLPAGSVVLLDSVEHAAGWALFSNPQVSLAVARGSGEAVAQLGSIARQAGIPVSLHGTGGAWLVADASADAERLRLAIYHSLDRKVCNTLNTLCLPQSRAVELVPVALRALEERAQQLGHGFKLHVVDRSRCYLPEELFATAVTIDRARGPVLEMLAESLAEDQLGREWEWERSPEISLCVVRDSEHAADLFNRYSPQFVACLISQDSAAHERFFQSVNAPFVGDGFTRWVDGQYALHRPELGLSNWQFGRLFGRSGILSGDSVYTLRTRVRQSDPDLHR